MIVSCLRTVVLYVLVVAAVRIMGKKQIGELEPVELVIVFLLSELASIPMQDMNLPLMSSVVPIATLISLEILISAITLKSTWLRDLLQGKPSVLIKDGKMDEAEMKKHRYNIDEIMEQIRNAGYADIRDVEYAVLENSGKISVIPSVSGKTVSPEDMKIDAKPGAMPYVVISDGKIIKSALNEAKISREKLLKMLKKKGITDAGQVFYAVVDSQGEFYYQKRGEEK